MPQRPRRRASDLKKPSAPNSKSALIGAGILLAVLAVWFAWQFATTLVPVRDGAPSWHPLEAKLVFYSEEAVPGTGDGPPGWRADLFEVQLDGSGLLNLTNSPQADEGGPAYSPSGRYLAYDTDRDGNFEIYIKDLDEAPNGPDWRLTDHGARDVAPAWHPDGDRLVFMSDRSSRPEFDIYQVNFDGTGTQRVTTEPSNWFPQYSVDASRIAMHVWRDIHVMSVADNSLRRLTNDPLNGMYPTWSPDGERLAFMSDRNGRMELFTMNADGSEQERLMTMPTGGAIDPRWSPDGDYIAFVHVSEASPQADQAEGGDRVIYLIELETGRVRRLSR